MMLAVISHDAGGAEILSDYVRQQRLVCLWVLEGPARQIFERKLGRLEFCSLETAVRQSKSILCSTSWQSDLEFNAIKLARSLGKRSAAFLDHWVNYRERFVRMGETCLPDEIWVGDAMAAHMARETFPATPVHLIENPYFRDVRRDLAAIQRRRLSLPDRISVIYICEPLSEHGLMQHGNERYLGYAEEDALRYFLANVVSLGKRVERILIRPHPSEPAAKYRWAVNEFDLPISIGGTRSLVEEIADSDWVVGCDSMAMVVGLFAGKKVISCIPPGGRNRSLPHPEILSLQSLIAATLNGAFVPV